MSKVLLWLARFYKLGISPFLRPCCRYYPSCSEYVMDCISRFGPWRGSLWGLLRLAKCNPLFPGGHDPVK